MVNPSIDQQRKPSIQKQPNKEGAMTLTIDMILHGTGLGDVQSAGAMQVVPILGDDSPTFAPPELEIGTRGYGTVLLRNTNDKPTIVPGGSGWIVPQRAQDHAVPGATFVRKGEEKLVDTAMCIQQSQPGLIPTGKHTLAILPVALRAQALAVRHVKDFRKLWEPIAKFNRALGVAESNGNLAAFLRTYEKQLDEFVAEFELVPRQIGAIVLVGGRVVGIERAPSSAYFAAVWEALVRVSYGSLAIQASRANVEPPCTRLPLVATAPTGDRARDLASLRRALADLAGREDGLVWSVLTALRSTTLDESPADESLDGATLVTVATNGLAGQVVRVTHERAGLDEVTYASLCVSAA
jgi:hypothetical protein